MEFVDGPGNDVVEVFVDGALVHGTSWEDYHRFDPEAAGERQPGPDRGLRTVPAQRDRGAGHDGQGFLVDGFRLARHADRGLPSGGTGARPRRRSARRRRRAPAQPRRRSARRRRRSNELRGSESHAPGPRSGARRFVWALFLAHLVLRAGGFLRRASLRPPDARLQNQRRNGLRCANRCDARLRGVQATQLRDEQVAAELAGPDRDAQVLPLVRAPHVPQGNPLTGRDG